MIECTQNEFKSDTCPSSNYSWSSSPLYSPNSSLSSSSNPSSISSSNFSSPCQFHRDDIFFPSVPEQNLTENVQRLNSTLDEGSNSSSESSPAKQERLSEQDNTVYTSDLEKIEQSGRSQYGNRRDVVYKTLIRRTRNYFWKDFTRYWNEKEIKMNFLKHTKGWIRFKDTVKAYYTENFQSEFRKLKDCSEENEEDFIQVLAIFMTHTHFFPRRPTRISQIGRLWKSAFPKFSPKNYKNLFSYPELALFFRIMKPFDILGKCNADSFVYRKALDSIIGFPVSRELIPVNHILS